GSPGTTANRPPASACLAPSSRSKRSVACCVPGPWHWKHLSERIGRMSRLNSMVAGSAAAVAAAAGVACGTDWAACIAVAHSTSPTATLQPGTRRILVLTENVLIQSKWSECDSGQEPVGTYTRDPLRG